MPEIDSVAWRLLCPAKINWDLKVLGRRPDGFHELRSWFAAVAFFDRLELQVGAKGFRCQGPQAEGVPLSESNLVLQAERSWRQAGGEAPSVAWCLRKNIPAGAGLGGGSSNAAAALHLLQEVAQRRLAEPRLSEIALQLGSDVPFFLNRGGGQWRGGRGEVVLAEAALPETWIVLLLPPVSLSTPKVFQALQADPWDGLAPPPPPWPRNPGPNDLQRAAYRLQPDLAAAAEDWARFGDLHMSGSGAAHFLVCPDQASAQRTAASLQTAFADLQVEAVPLLPKWPQPIQGAATP
ncbi:MAG: 4-(cytidine 5'-diphospho)-2-C-methyl-D-erythritol kinase [Planctomycetota bacterium]|nr:MAG: 4-(cytidine 5'-diphospho)-2-C-methyl-D-erythritol kinase [Planctomycetota bacterium]